MLISGNLLEKILNDIKAKIQNTSERKIHLYSAHDYNPAHILIFFNVMFNHIPNYGACIIFEVYDFGIKHGIKVTIYLYVAYKQYKLSILFIYNVIFSLCVTE